jgi:hypothetical protein
MSNISNVTTVMSSYDYDADMPKFWIYLSEGLILVITNILVILTIAVNRTLRREKHYVLIGGMAVNDVMLGEFTQTYTFIHISRIL